MLSKARLAKAMVVAAVYTALTIVLAPISYGIIQFRVSDSMLALAFVRSLGVEAVVGLTIGGFLSNLPSPWGFWDWVFGPVANFLASLALYLAGRAKQGLASYALGSIAASGLIALTIGLLELSAIFSQPAEAALYIFISELVAVGALGWVVVKFVSRLSK